MTDSPRDCEEMVSEAQRKGIPTSLTWTETSTALTSAAAFASGAVFLFIARGWGEQTSSLVVYGIAFVWLLVLWALLERNSAGSQVPYRWAGTCGSTAVLLAMVMLATALEADAFATFAVAFFGMAIASPLVVGAVLYLMMRPRTALPETLVGILALILAAVLFSTWTPVAPILVLAFLWVLTRTRRNLPDILVGTALLTVACTLNLSG